MNEAFWPPWDKIENKFLTVNVIGLKFSIASYYLFMRICAKFQGVKTYSSEVMVIF